MPSTEPEPTGRGRDELLDHVYGRARRLWWQRRVLPVGAATVVLAALLTAPVLLRDGGTDRRIAATDASTTLVDETTTTEAAFVEETTTSIVATAATAIGSATTRPHATTTTIVCRNSSDERCGPFRWDPAPGPNAGLTVEISFAPSSPRVGQDVVFTVVAHDADAVITTECAKAFGDEGGTPFGCDAVGCRVRYGPWTPPARQVGERTYTYHHTYAAAGTYDSTFSYFSDPGPEDACGNPYSSSGWGAAKVVVSP